jgi:RNA polymerase sigma-70 factor (sigma-E family)
MRGRDAEFDAYVREHRPALLRAATLLTAGDAHLAEDLVQTTLTRLYVSWPAFRRARSPAAYSRRTLVNALIDEKRRPWRREHSSSTVPDRAVTTLDEADHVNAALAQLAPRMRAAVVLRYYHDLSVADTADALNCSTGTVKSQTARALERLRELLDIDEPTSSRSATDLVSLNSCTTSP